VDKITVGRRPSPTGLRRAMGVILVAGLCVSAVTVFREAPAFPRSAPPIATGTPPPSAPAATHQPPPTAPSSTTSAKTTSTTATEAKLPKGPGNTQPGILLMASPMPHGTFDIAEMVLFDAPTWSIRLGPPRLALAGSDFSKAKPVATQVQVSAGDQPVVVPDGRISRPTDIALNAPASRIELRYKLDGITVRSIPSPAGRALAAISPMAGGVPKDFPVVMMINGSTVRNIVCPSLPLRIRTCWIGQPPQLRVKPKLHWNKAVIVVQFDLPKP
jgi:hypothetical protein